MSSSLHAHPHVLMDYEITLVMQDGRVQHALLELFSRDELYIAGLLQDYDRDGDKRLDEREMERLRQHLFRELRRQGFFVEWSQAGRRWRSYHNESFTATIDSDATMLHVRCLLPLDIGPEGLAIAVYDRDYYYDIQAALNPLRVDGAPDLEVIWELRVNTEVSFYYRQIHPVELHMELQSSDTPGVRARWDVSASGLTPEDFIPLPGQTQPQRTGSYPVSAMSATMKGPPTGIARPSFSKDPRLLWGKWLRWLSETQQSMREWMMDLRVQARETGSWQPYQMMLLLAAAYGFIHAAGPGHGKLVLAAYLLDQRSSLWHGMGLAAGVALLHGTAGVILVWVVHVLLDEAVQGALPDVTRWTQLAGSALLVLLGAAMMVERVCKFSCGTRRSGGLPVLLALGMVPCPAVVLIMLFCAGFGAWGLGLAMVACLVAGMASCLAVVALAVLLGRDQALRRLQKTAGHKQTQRVENGIAWISALLLCAIGGVWMLASWQEVRIFE